MNENIRLLKPFFRGLPIIILSMFIAVIAAKKYLNYVTPMYESTAKLKLADVQEGVPSANLFKDLDVFASANKIATEIEVLKSTTLIQKTLDQLSFNLEVYRKGSMRTVELFDNSPIHVEGFFESDKPLDKRYTINVISEKKYHFSYPNSEVKINGSFGKPLKIKGGTIIIILNNDFIEHKKEVKIIDTYEFEFLSKEKLMDNINKNIDIIPVDKDVPVIRINLKSSVPEKAAQFVNKLAETYIKDYIENKYRAANTAVSFLNNEILLADKKLSKSEIDIQNYRDQKKITNLHQETETDLRKISQLKIQLSNLKMNLNAIKDLNKYIESGKENYLDLAANFEAFTDLLSTEMIKTIKRLQGEKRDLLLTYTPENEKITTIDAKIKDLTDYQIESIKNTEKNLQIKYNDLSNDIDEAEKVFIGLPEKEKIINILNREFNLYEKNYNFLNEKRIEAEIAKSAKIAFHKIITPAIISKSPVSPIRGIIIIVAAFLAFMASVLLIYIIHYAKAKVNDIYTIEKSSTIPIAIATPYLKNKKEIETNFLKEAMQMELKGMIQKHSIVVLTSYDHSKDHLFHSKNLIQAFRTQNRKVLALDATGELEKIISEKDYFNYSENKYLSYTKIAFQKEIETKMQGYDICIIHNQAVLDNKLSLLFMNLASQNLMILDSRDTSEKTILKIELLKDEYTLPNFWFVLNKSNYNPSLFSEAKKIWKKRIKKQVV